MKLFKPTALSISMLISIGMIGCDATSPDPAKMVSPADSTTALPSVTFFVDGMV